MSTISELRKQAESADAEALWAVLRHQHPELMFAALVNRNLTDGMARFIAGSRSASPETLGALAGDVRFAGSYPLKRLICRNPRTPLRVATALLKYIKLFDLADLTRDRSVHPVIRQRVEVMLLDRVPSLPLGLKAALARRVSQRIVEEIMHRGDRRVIDACLESPRLTEEHLFGIIMKEHARPTLIQAVAEHPRWSSRYTLRYALVRSPHTPMKRSALFIRDLKATDLRLLYADARLPRVTGPFIYRELVARGEPLEEPPQQVFEMQKEEADGIRWEMDLYSEDDEDDRASGEPPDPTPAGGAGGAAGSAPDPAD